MHDHFLLGTYTVDVIQPRGCPLACRALPTFKPRETGATQDRFTPADTLTEGRRRASLLSLPDNCYSVKPGLEPSYLVQQAEFAEQECMSLHV